MADMRKAARERGAAEGAEEEGVGCMMKVIAAAALKGSGKDEMSGMIAKDPKQKTEKSSQKPKAKSTGPREIHGSRHGGK